MDMLNLLREVVSRYDALLFKAVNGLSGQPVIDSIMVYFTTAGYGWALSLICLTILFAGWVKKNLALRVAGYSGLVAYVLAGTMSQVFKLIWQRPRPLLSLYDVHVVDVPLFANSFPSGHTTAAFAVAFSCTSFYPKLGYVLYPLAALIAFSRIYLGVHYPFDVLYGALLGLLLGWIATYILQSRLARKPVPETNHGQE